MIQKTTLSDKTWRKIVSENDTLDFSSLASTLVYGDDILISNHYMKIVFWDMKDPRNLKKVSEVKLTSSDTRKLKIYDDFLYAFGGKDVFKINLSEIQHPHATPIVKWKKEQHRRSGCMIKERIFITYENGISEIKKGTLHEVATINNDKFFSRYPTDIIAHGDYIYVVGRHAGLHIFKITDGEKFEFIKNITTGYTPTDISWYVPGKKLLLVGNEDVIIVDTSIPEKAQRLKSAKITGVQLCGQYQIEKEMVLTAGYKLGTSTFTPVVADIILEPSPKVITKQILKNLGSTEGSVQRSEIKGFVVKDSALLLFTDSGHLITCEQ